MVTLKNKCLVHLGKDCQAYNRHDHTKYKNHIILDYCRIENVVKCLTITFWAAKIKNLSEIFVNCVHMRDHMWIPKESIKWH